MNHLVFLDTQAGELEKILSGVKSMVVKEFDPAKPPADPVSPGDSLFFLRLKDDCNVRVKASVVRVISISSNLDEDFSATLKEMQPKLQLTESQYHYWSAKKNALLVEFDCAHKVEVIRVASNKITDRSDWIAFEESGLITE